MFLEVTSGRKLRCSAGHDFQGGMRTPLKYRGCVQGTDPPAAVISCVGTLKQLLGRLHSSILCWIGLRLTVGLLLRRRSPPSASPRLFPRMRTHKVCDPPTPSLHFIICINNYLPQLILGEWLFNEPGVGCKHLKPFQSPSQGSQHAGGQQVSSALWLNTLVHFLGCPLNRHKPVFPKPIPSGIFTSIITSLCYPLSSRYYGSNNLLGHLTVPYTHNTR